MIKIEDYIDGTKFESIADFGFGDKYTIEIPLSLEVLHNFLVNFNEERLPIIYVDSDRVKDFFNITNNYNDNEFILLSHNGDTTFVKDDVEKKPKCVKKWFGQNIDFENTDNIISLPIGLERPHWSQNRYGVYGFKHNKIFEYSKLIFSKNKLCYLNFNPNTNKEKREWIVPHFGSEDWCNIRMGGIHSSLDTYYTECKESHFVLCPDGNGIDCHRNWEMLYLGVVPIIEKSFFHNKIYQDLPVLIVEDFKSLSKDFLYENIIDNKNFPNLEKLKFKYWENLIKK
jgi:hypothetical protein